MRFLLLSLFTLFSFNLHAKSLEVHVDCRTMHTGSFSDYLMIDGVITLSDTQNLSDARYNMYDTLNGVLNIRLPYERFTSDVVITDGHIDAVMSTDNNHLSHFFYGTVSGDNASDDLYSLIRFSNGSSLKSVNIEIIYNFKKYKCMFNL